MAWTAPRTWVANEKVSASLMNTHWRDQLSVIATAGITGWESYTPTWTSSGTAPAIGDGTLAGTYCQIGKSVFGEARMTCGSTSTYGSGVYYWSIPVTAEAASRSGGGALLYDSSVTTYHTAALDMDSTVRVHPYYGGTTMTSVGPTGPFTWTTSDQFSCWFAYEAA